MEGLSHVTAATKTASTGGPFGSTSSARELSDQFLSLLVAQLRNQDPLEPVKNEQFVSELAQLQALDSQLKIVESNKSLLLQTSLATGAGLIGKQITGVFSDGEVRQEVTGLVESVKVENGTAVYRVRDANGNVRDVLPSDLLNITPVAAPVTSSFKAQIEPRKPITFLSRR